MLLAMSAYVWTLHKFILCLQNIIFINAFYVRLSVCVLKQFESDSHCDGIVEKLLKMQWRDHIIFLLFRAALIVPSTPYEEIIMSSWVISVIACMARKCCDNRLIDSSGFICFHEWKSKERLRSTRDKPSHAQETLVVENIVLSKCTYC